MTNRLDKSCLAKIGQTICSDSFSDFISRVCGCDEFVTVLDINAIKARIFESGTGDCHMNFSGACVFEEFDNATAGCPTHNTIINHNDAFSFYNTSNSTQFHANALFTKFLSRLNKCSCHILIFNQAHFVRQARFFSVA